MMLLVAIQAGIQPVVTRVCVAGEVAGASLVVVENLVSMVLAIVLSPPGTFQSWSCSDSLMLAGPAAFCYSLRSFFKQAAYRRCDAVTFNICNQTKVVFCALAAWLLLHEVQSRRQVVALVVGMSAGLLLVVPSHIRAKDESKKDVSDAELAPGQKERTAEAIHQGSKQLNLQTAHIERGKQEALPPLRKRRPPAEGHPEPHCAATAAQTAASQNSTNQHRTIPPRKALDVDWSGAAMGAALALLTAGCSGLGAALSQLAMKRSARPSTLFNFELAMWGMPVAIAVSGSGMAGERISGVTKGWRLRTLIPVALQAGGGLLVSAVVKSRGGVAMGLCTVVGIAVSALTEAFLMRRAPTLRQVSAASLAALSILLHQW